MRQVIGELLPLAVVVMASPLNVIAVILLLFSPRPIAAAGAYLGGFFGGVAAVVILLTVVGRHLDWTGGSETSRFGAVLRIGLGVALAAGGVMKLRGTGSPDAPSLPAWMDGISTMAPARAASTGLAIGALNPKNLAVAATAAVAIGSAGLTTTEAVAVVVVYVVLASAGVAAPVVVALVGGDRATAPLAAARNWLERNHAVVLGVMYLVFAPVLVGRGLAAF